MDIQGRRVLVTGADGFIGSHLTELLAAEGARVRALALYNSFNSWGWLEETNCLDKIEVVTGDVRDGAFCKNLCRDIEVVFHLAALVAIPHSYRAPQSYVDTNVKGTLNVCQAAVDNNVRRFVQMSTSEVYGTACYLPIDEKHPLQPQSPYSASKVGADAVAKSYHYAFNLPLVVARAFNTYGPRQSARAVIPNIITQIASQRDKVRLGDTAPTRDFNYVLDTCRGLVALAQCDAALGEEVNIGSNEEISIGDLFLLVRELMNSEMELEQERDRFRPEKSEVRRLKCDNSKFLRLTGFVPRYSLREGLALTIDWLRAPERLSRYKPAIYNV